MTVLQFRQFSPGKGMTTTNALVTALGLRELKSVKVLIIAQDAAAYYLNLKYDPEVKFIYNYVKSNTLDGDKLRRYCTCLYERVHFMYYKPDSQEERAIEAILRAAEDVFDYVILDIPDTVKADKEVIQIDTLQQCDRAFEDYYDKLREREKRSARRSIQLIGSYHDALKHMSLKHVKKIYRQKAVYGIPFDPSLHKAAADQHLLVYMKHVMQGENMQKNGLKESVKALCTGIENVEISRKT